MTYSYCPGFQVIYVTAHKKLLRSRFIKKIIITTAAGYDAFSFDITEYLVDWGLKQTLILYVKDPTDAQVRGRKQATDSPPLCEGSYRCSGKG